MKVTIEEILESGNMSAASLNSMGVLVDQMFMGSIVADWSGTAPRGIIKLQVSNDDVPVKPQAPRASTTASGAFVSNTDPAANVVNWADLPSATYTISAGDSGCQIIKMDTMPFKWLRAVYTKTSGIGTINMTYFAKG